MDGKTAVAKVLKKEGVDFITCFPLNPVIEAAATEGIRPIKARTERVVVGMAGLDFETAVREKILILSIVLNNSRFGGYDRMLPTATQRYNVDRVSGDYAKVAEALGFHAERVTQPAEVALAIKRAKEVLAAGQPAFIEIITRVDTDFSKYE